MAFVTSLRFDRDRGAVLVNEELLTERRRRKFYLDGVQSLLTAEQADAWGLEALYAGTGSPSVNQEVVDLTRAALRERFERDGRGARKGAATPTLKDVGLLVGEALRKIVRRDTNLRLYLNYGFETDDVVRGSYARGEKRVTIQQAKVKAKALEIVNGKQMGRPVPIYQQTKALLFGVGRGAGIGAFHLDVANGNLAFNLEAYEALGPGKYALGTALARYLNNLSFPQRQAGCPPAEGLFELLTVALAGREANHLCGGNLQITYLDGTGASHAERFREFRDEQSRLALHVAQAVDAGLLGRDEAIALLDDALFKGATRDAVERDLFARASDAAALDLVLRGYKRREIPSLVAPPAKAPARGRSRR